MEGQLQWVPFSRILYATYFHWALSSLVIVRPHRSAAYVDAACYRRIGVVCLSVGHNCESCKNGWTSRSAVWVVDSGGLKEACIRWGCTLVQPGEYHWTVYAAFLSDDLPLVSDAVLSLHFACVIDNAKCIVVTWVCVCVSVCPWPHAHTTARTRM